MYEAGFTNWCYLWRGCEKCTVDWHRVKAACSPAARFVAAIPYICGQVKAGLSVPFNLGISVL